MLRNHLPVEVLTLYYGPGIKGGNDGAIISYLWYYASQEPHAERRGLEEDVEAVLQAGKNRKWNASFSPVQVGKEHLYRLVREMGLLVHTRVGWQTKELREKAGLKKTKSKSKQRFESHAVDAWVLASCMSGAQYPTCTRVWYLVPARLHRRQLHRLQASKGGERKPYGGTRSLGLKRGT